MLIVAFKKVGALVYTFMRVYKVYCATHSRTVRRYATNAAAAYMWHIGRNGRNTRNRKARKVIMAHLRAARNAYIVYKAR